MSHFKDDGRRARSTALDVEAPSVGKIKGTFRRFLLDEAASGQREGKKQSEQGYTNGPKQFPPKVLPHCPPRVRPRLLSYMTAVAYLRKVGQRITQMQYLLHFSVRTSENSVTAKFAEFTFYDVR